MYFYRVVANNSNGSVSTGVFNFTTGESSESACCWYQWDRHFHPSHSNFISPPPLPAPGPPDNVRLVPVNSTTLSLSWSPPLQPNGVLIGYRYTCNQSNSLMNIMMEASLDPNVTNVLITNLDPFTSYIHLLCVCLHCPMQERGSL